MFVDTASGGKGAAASTWPPPCGGLPETAVLNMPQRSEGGGLRFAGAEFFWLDLQRIMDSGAAAAADLGTNLPPRWVLRILHLQLDDRLHQPGGKCRPVGGHRGGWHWRSGGDRPVTRGGVVHGVVELSG